MSRLIASVVLVAGLAGAAMGWQMITPVAASHSSARPFAVRTLDGHTVRLADLRGRPVVIDFWATWCAPCRASMPHLSAVQQRFASRGLVVLGLSVDDASAQSVRGFAESMRVSFPVAIASEQVLDDFGPIRSIPTTIFINRRGEIVRRVVGYLDQETLEQFVREIL